MPSRHKGLVKFISCGVQHCEKPCQFITSIRKRAQKGKSEQTVADRMGAFFDESIPSAKTGKLLARSGGKGEDDKHQQKGGKPARYNIKEFIHVRFL